MDESESMSWGEAPTPWTKQLDGVRRLLKDLHELHKNPTDMKVVLLKFASKCRLAFEGDL